MIRIYANGSHSYTADSYDEAVAIARKLGGNATIVEDWEPTTPVQPRSNPEPNTCYVCGAAVTNRLGNYCGCAGWD